MNAPIKSPPKHFLDLSDHDGATLRAIIADARARKEARNGLPKGVADADRPLEGRVLAMIFDRQSTRTRISFDVAMRQLGGTTLRLTGNEMQLAREETIADTARVISRYVDAAMIRLLDHEMVEELAANASIPVINGLTKWSHPCQVMADVMTYEEHKGPIKGAIVAWSGDSNNVLTSWIHAAKKFDFHLRVASPRELSPDPEVKQWAKGGKIEFGSDPQAAVKDADCVISDAWVSQGRAVPARPCKLHKNYFRISIVPPAPSITDLAFSLVACTLKFSLAFSSPVARIFTRSVWLINPLIYRFSGVTSVKPYFSAS